MTMSVMEDKSLASTKGMFAFPLLSKQEINYSSYVLALQGKGSSWEIVVIC